MKIAVITSMYGSNSDLRSLTNEEKSYDVDYFAFVDREHETTSGWNKIVSKNHSIVDSKWGYRRNAKIFKVLPELFLPQYDVYIWVDSELQIKKDPNIICKTYLKDNDLAIFNHSQRNCVYDEGEIIKKLGWEHSETLETQFKFYESNNFPKNFGLYEMTSYIKRKNDVTKAMGTMWWELICKFSSRDQLSFPYVIWKLQKELKISILPGMVREVNDFFYLAYKELNYNFKGRW